MEIKPPIQLNAYIPQVIKKESNETISRYWGKPSLPPGFKWPIDMKDEDMDDDDSLKTYTGLFYAQFLVSDLPEEVAKLLPPDAGMISIFTRFFTVKMFILNKSDLALCVPTDMPVHDIDEYDEASDVSSPVESHVLQKFVVLKEDKCPYSEDELDDLPEDKYEAIEAEYNKVYGISDLDFPHTLTNRIDLNTAPESNSDNIYSEDKFLGADFFENNDREEIPASYNKIFQITGSGPLGFDKDKNDTYFYGTGNIFINKEYEVQSFASCD